jgi:hypothetical protein
MVPKCPDRFPAGLAETASSSLLLHDWNTAILLDSGGFLYHKDWQLSHSRERLHVPTNAG